MFKARPIFQFILIGLLGWGLVACSTISHPNKDQSTSKNATYENRKLSDSELNLNVTKETLDNGLRLLLVENAFLPIVSYYTFYGVGSKHEIDGMTGSSHFLEHLMFKGTKDYPAGRFDVSIEKNGGRTNAYTSLDQTVYYEKFPSTIVDTIIDLEVDRMNNLILDPVAFEKERSVILEERKMRLENKPSGQLFYAMMTEVFEGTPYGRSAIGKIPDLKSVSRDQVYEHYKNYYAPNNAIVVIVGDIDTDELLPKLREAYGKLKRVEKTEELKKVREADYRYHHRGRYGRSIHLKGNSPLPIFTIAYRGEPLGTRRAYVMDILSAIMSHGASSYLEQKYVRGRKVYLSNIYAANYNLKHNGLFFISGQLAKGTNLPAFERRIKRDMKKSCRKAITERALQKTKNQFLIGYYRELQTNSGIASFIGNREDLLGDYSIYKNELKTYQSISLTEVMETCESIFKKEKPLFLTVWDKNPKKS